MSLVDCGTVRTKAGDRRVVWLNGQYYQWDQDALDRKFGLGCYLFQPRFDDFKIDPRRYREHKPQTDDMRQMLEEIRHD